MNPGFRNTMGKFLCLAAIISFGAHAWAEDSALPGKWVRPDGGYELHVQEIQPDSTATVTYHNPSPIRIGEARLEEKDGKPTLFVRFDDPAKGYPGSTYNLTLQDGILSGTYFQAPSKQTFDIVFVR